MNGRVNALLARSRFLSGSGGDVDDLLTRAVRHEAAHAVIGVVLGRDVTAIRLWPPNERTAFAGQVAFGVLKPEPARVGYLVDLAGDVVDDIGTAKHVGAVRQREPDRVDALVWDASLLVELWSDEIERLAAKLLAEYVDDHYGYP